MHRNFTSEQGEGGVGGGCKRKLELESKKPIRLKGTKPEGLDRTVSPFFST